jgi:hypothetical protein
MNRSFVILLLLVPLPGCVPEKTETQTNLVPLLTAGEARWALWELYQKALQKPDRGSILFDLSPPSLQDPITVNQQNPNCVWCGTWELT